MELQKTNVPRNPQTTEEKSALTLLAPNQIISAAQQRKTLLLSLIPQDPGAAYELMFSERELDAYQEILGDNDVLEKHVDVTGTLNVTIADDFENGTSQTFYALVVDDQVLGSKTNGSQEQVLSASIQNRFQVYSGKTMPEVLSNSQVQIVGMKMNEFLVLGTLPDQGQANVLQAADPHSLGNKKVLIMPVNFSDNSNNKPESQPVINDILNNGTKKYFEENSDQQTHIDEVKVMDWVTLPITTEDACKLHPATLALELAQLAMIIHDPNIDFSVYNNIGSIFTLIPDVCDSTFTAISYGAGYLSINTPTDGVIIAGLGVIKMVTGNHEGVRSSLWHESAHHLGILHADVFHPSVIDHTESYRELFDLMGRRSPNSWYINAGLRESVYWLKVQPNCRPGPIGQFHGICIQKVEAPGIYYIKPIELPFSETPTNPVRAIAINTSTEWKIMIEYKQPIGFDNVTPESPTVFTGATIHLMYKDQTRGGASYLFDTTPNSSLPSEPVEKDFLDAHLNPGQTVNIYEHTVTTCSATQYASVGNNSTLTVAINTPCPAAEEFGNVMPMTFKNYESL